MTDFKYATSFRQAKHFHRGRRRKIRIIVLHSAETPEKDQTAEGVQGYFLHPGAPASAHMTYDANSCAQSVLLGDTAFGAGSANADGIHIEHAGRAAQTAAQWADEYSTAMLKRSAVGTADLLTRFNLDHKFLGAKQLKNPSMTGITTHAEVSKAWPSNGHNDPGPHFPLRQYMAWVGDALAGRLTMRVANGRLVLGDQTPQPTSPTTPVGWERVLRLAKPPMTGDDVRAVQRAIRIAETGTYDRATATTVASWQHTVMNTPLGDPNSGLVGLFTARKMGIAK